METVTSSHFVSNFANTAMGSSDPKLTLANNALKSNQMSTHNGLRPLMSNIDMLRLSNNPKSTTVELRKERFHAPFIRSGMNVVFVGAEVAPWSKTGGLGDVLGGLPPALAARGHRVMTVSPRYDQYRDGWDTSVTVEFQVGNRTETVRYFHTYKRGVDRIFVDHPLFLARVWGITGSKLYGPKAGADYEDNQLRFSLLCQAALEAPRVLNLNNNPNFSGPYGENVVFIANDWHTALLPAYLKAIYQPKGIYNNAKVAFCIHNIVYQGRFALADYPRLHLPEELRPVFEFMDGYDRPIKGRKINWMKAGILQSDRVVTVSPYYAQELISGVERGVELDDVVRQTGVTGIVNGMDVQEWNPITDKYIGINFNITTVMTAKPLIKEALQAEVGLPVDRNIPLIGFIGRLEEQKGSDILAEAIPRFIKENVQIVVLGTGKEVMEKQIEQLEILYPEKARGVTKFNSPLAHMIVAGADFMLIPSRFEPCGLIQLYSMRYGTVPVVASTGGLVDTVKEGYTGFHMGRFSANCDMVDPADISAVETTVHRALTTYNSPAMREMVINCMTQDFSWKEPARKWEELLLSLGVAGSRPGFEGTESIPLATENIATP
uniref:Granule-bound starch synthase 1, chloroplastic/amyloplastic n=12 Tax=Amaranthus TaxID=3564 RepID=C9K223_AMACR|nr:granule-bound starch synthase I [Amaranthus cruentus]BAJ09326.1 granule bound starch synthase I [Amaranthus caudatus]BAJ09327.1 granule bound starch synthase I [Amaranthus cruentus]BAJ09328.1 granule bound starch synthase I [Amaranthus hypochondriacus]